MGEDDPTPIFLTVQEVLDIHRNQIELYGGSLGILHPHYLESAVAQPQATYGGRFLHGDVFEMAAVYLYHLVKNHAFQDGNKRVGTASALVFLALNGYELVVDEDDLTAMVLSVTNNETRRDDVAEFFRENCRPEA